MIVVRVIGGLGNQMFQYAAGWALASRLGVPCRLDLRAFRSYELRDYALSRWSIDADAASMSELASYPEWISAPARSLQRIGIRTRWYSELEFGRFPGWKELPDGTLLDGYFQSEKLFEAHRATLLRQFQPQTPLPPRALELVEEARSCESVMVHVRRGDYAHNPAALRFHGLCTETYYDEALATVRARCSKPKVFVFSDDMPWVQENLDIEDAVHVTGHDQSPEVDLAIMAACRHHIVANSSFSWWGAWLSQNEGGLRIAPYPWFVDPAMKGADPVPEAWTRIPR